jgi:hypothetical protein
MRPIPSKLLPIKELAEETFAERTREDFIRDRPLGHKQSASYVYEQKTFAPHVLQYCSKKHWTIFRDRLVEIARDSPLFLATHFIFPYEDNICVVSQIGDICLADVIETIILTEEDISAILTQVNSIYYFLEIILNHK